MYRYPGKKRNIINFPVRNAAGEEESMLAKLDTGADVNLISRNAVQKLGLETEDMQPEM